MSRPQPISRPFTYADYCGWDEDVRGELIDGQFYDMTPAPLTRHQSISAALSYQVFGHLRGKTCQVFPAPFDVRLPRSNELDDDVTTIVQPDLSVICDPSKIDAKGCRGAPDWIIEILSPSTAAKDQIKKLALYERVGVREFWLLHVIDRIVTIYRLNDDGRYGRPEVVEAIGKTACTTLPGFQIDWDEAYAEVPPNA